MNTGHKTLFQLRCATPNWEVHILGIMLMSIEISDAVDKQHRSKYEVLRVPDLRYVYIRGTLPGLYAPPVFKKNLRIFVTWVRLGGKIFGER